MTSPIDLEYCLLWTLSSRIRKDSGALLIRPLTNAQTYRAMIRLRFRKLLTTLWLISSKCSDKFGQVVWSACWSGILCIFALLSWGRTYTTFFRVAKVLSLKELSAIFGVCRQTTATWLTAWEKGGIAALLDKPRSGRPCKLAGAAKHYVPGKIGESSRSLKAVLAQLPGHLGIPVSITSLKRVCKQAGLGWKRVRKSLKSKRGPDLFGQSRQQLAALPGQAGQRQIDLVF
ncbi:MAG: helix-turn-helix domain-containing protein [Methylovulum sp.]|nr:helix-turn-helix domain-containing protein [Methylovulum sp.]